MLPLLFSLIVSVGSWNAPSPEPTHKTAPYSVDGWASHYYGTRGFIGEPTVALPLELGGRYTGTAHGWVLVCADRCVELRVVDYCQCYWGTADQRVVDLSEPAWAAITDRPLSEGLVRVTVIYPVPKSPLPDTAVPDTLSDR